MNVKTLESLQQIIDLYSVFLIDVGGVIHNGVETYPYSFDALKYLRNKDKTVILFTNAPRPKQQISNKISDLGYELKNEAIFTSGDFFVEKIKQDYTTKEKAYLIGAEKNKDLGIESLFAITNKIEEAKYIIILEFFEASDDKAKYDQLLKKAANLGLTAICPNPDAIVDFGDKKRYPSGYLGEKYESMGGKVIYFGKPYPDFYDFALAGLNIAKNKILAIGDNLNTDILGAEKYGIDSLLIKNGIYKNIDSNNIDLLFEEYGIFPTYVLEYLKI